MTETPMDETQALIANLQGIHGALYTKAAVKELQRLCIRVRELELRDAAATSMLDELGALPNFERRIASLTQSSKAGGIE